MKRILEMIMKKNDFNAKQESMTALNEFTRASATKGIPESASTMIYSFLQQELPVPNYTPLHLADDVCTKYGVVDEDLEKLVEALALLLRRRLPPPTRGTSGKPIVRTIEDLILFVWSCPEYENQKRE